MQLDEYDFDDGEPIALIMEETLLPMYFCASALVACFGVSEAAGLELSAAGVEELLLFDFAGSSCLAAGFAAG
jgi:hypothetical protein